MKNDKEQFKTYYERKKNRKHSLFNTSVEAYTIILIMAIAWSPSFLIFIYAYKLGPWWWVLLIGYSTLISILIYIVLRYREIIGIQGYFTEEEFKKEFKNELWWFNIVDNLRNIFRL